MRRPSDSRPAFPFLGASLLLAVAAASFAACLPAVFLSALALICARLGLPGPEPIPVRVRGSRR